MRRRTWLGLAAGALTGLAGCLADGRPSAGADRDPATSSGCPDLPGADRRVCPGDAGRPLAVERSSGEVGGEGWTLDVTVTNRSDERYRFAPFAWSVFGRVERAWTGVIAESSDRPRVELAPDEGYVWQLSSPGADPGGDGVDQQVVIEVEPGRYAFVEPFWGARRVAAIVPFAVHT